MGSAVPEVGGRAISPCCLWQQNAEPHKKNYHLTKLELLALKWAVTEHFKKYLLYQPFLVKTDNNPLTYIMMTPNLDATGHQWVRALAWFNFELEYQNGCDNTVADTLSWVTTCPDPDMVKSILNRLALGAVNWAKVHDPTIVKGDCNLERGTCCSILHSCTDARHWLGQSPKGGSNVECSFRMAEGTEEDRFEGISSWTCLQWRRLTDLTQLTEFYDSSQKPYICTQCSRARPKICYYL